MKQVGDRVIPALNFIAIEDLGESYQSLQVPYLLFINEDLEAIDDSDKLLISQLIINWLDEYPVNKHPIGELNIIYQALIELNVVDEVLDAYFGAG